MAHGLSPEEEKELILSVGTHRSGRRLSPLEVAQFFGRMTTHGASLKDCADLVQFEGTTMVSRFLRLLELEPDIQHLVDWGQSGSTVAFTAATELSKLDRSEQRPAVREILENGLKSQEVKQLVQLRRRSGKSLDVCAEEIVRLRPQIERRHVIIGAVTDPEVKSALESVLQTERDRYLLEVIRSVFGLRSGFACRLGVDRFTVTADEITGDRILAHEEFEQEINSGLKERIKSD